MNLNTIPALFDLETVAVIFGFICVFLTVKENILCWPTGIVNILCFMALFTQAKLYGQVFLQVVFLVLSIYGWRQWLHGGGEKKELAVTRLSVKHFFYFLYFTAGFVGLSYYLVSRFSLEKIVILDITITALSLIAQFLLARKKLEAWVFWIAVDVLSVGLFVYKRLYKTGILYFVFLLLAIKGFFEWRKSYRKRGRVPAAHEGAGNDFSAFWEIFAKEQDFQGSLVQRESTGLIIGKFMPLHRGHVHLIETALKKVRKLTVLVCSSASEPIPGELRFRWVKEAFPAARVCHLTDENPQEPKDHPDFWNIWTRSVRKFCPTGPDWVFTSEDYGDELARRLGSRHFPVDKGRGIFPVSGSDIRAFPLRHWDYIPRHVRPYFVKKVVLYGPESTGKTTLARQLAEHFDTLWIPEYARGMLDEKDAPVELSDIPKIARGQVALEEEAVKKANRVLFCDTDLIVTKIYSEYFFDTCPRPVLEEISRRTYDLYLLLDVDVPWIADPQRDAGHIREQFFEIFKSELDVRERPYEIIRGDYGQRLQRAIRAVKKRIFVQI